MITITMTYNLRQDNVEVTSVDSPMFRGTLRGGAALLDFRATHNPRVTSTRMEKGLTGNVIVDTAVIEGV